MNVDERRPGVNSPMGREKTPAFVWSSAREEEKGLN